MKSLFFTIVWVLVSVVSIAQFKADRIKWTADGTGRYENNSGAIVKVNNSTGAETELMPAKALATTTGGFIEIADFSVHSNETKILLFTNTVKVWRYKTRGNYYLYDVSARFIRQIGAKLPDQSLLYAKLSPDATKVAYVSKNNIYVEDVLTGKTTVLTSTNNTPKLINGTFDWVYEEEFGCRDGFRWSADSKSIAYWQVDANKIRDYYMLNTTDSNYSQVIPVEYPKVGELPSPVRIGVVNVETAVTVWMKLPGDPANNYLPRMEWSGANELVVQQLNRKQNESTLYFCNATTGETKPFYKETDKAWIDIKSRWNDDDPVGWDFINKGAAFLWVSEKDGWRHIYKVDRNGKETLLTVGNYDIATLSGVNEVTNELYFIASPNNPTQRYLFKVKMDGKSKP